MTYINITGSGGRGFAVYRFFHVQMKRMKQVRVDEEKKKKELISPCLQQQGAVQS